MTLGDGIGDVAKRHIQDREVRFALENEGKSLRMTGLRVLGRQRVGGKKTSSSNSNSPMRSQRRSSSKSSTRSRDNEPKS